MAVDIVTREDLQLFRQQLIQDIQALVIVPRPTPEWLKNHEVKALLKVSSNTIQRLRVAGKLKATKVGGVHYYRYSDIVALLDNGA